MLVLLTPSLVRRRRHKGDLLRCRLAPEDRVAVREAAKAFDHVDIAHRIAAGALAPGAVGQAFEQFERAALVGEVFAVVQRHVEELAPGRRQGVIKAARQRVLGDGAGRRVSHVGARRVAKDVARDLVEQQHQRQGALRRRLPSCQRTRGGALVIGEKQLPQPLVVLRGAAEPELAMRFALGVARRPEPEIDQRLRPFGQRPAIHQAACDISGASPASVVRRMSRTSLRSKRRARCMVCRLSHITRSPTRHLCA